MSEPDGRGDRRDGRRGEVAGAARARAPRPLARQGGGALPGAVRGRARPARRRLHAGARARQPPAGEARHEPAAGRRERGRPGGCGSCSSTSPRRSASAAGSRSRRRTRRSTATCYGDDLGLLIGRHGQTIDAVQVLAARDRGRLRARSAERSSSTQPATGTAAAGRSSRCALRSAEEAVRTALAGRARADERGRAQDRPHCARRTVTDVTTVSEGEGPNRRVVVEPSLTAGALEAWLHAVVETPGLTALDLDARPGDARSTTRCVPCRWSRVSTARSWTSAPGTALRGSRSRTRCPAARSSCSRPSAAAASSCAAWAPPNARVVWGRAEEQETDWAGSRSRRRSRRPRLRRSGACRSCGPAAPPSSGSARAPISTSLPGLRRSSRPSRRRRRRGSRCSQDRSRRRPASRAAPGSPASDR